MEIDKNLLVHVLKKYKQNALDFLERNKDNHPSTFVSDDKNVYTFNELDTLRQYTSNDVMARLFGGLLADIERGEFDVHIRE